MRKIQERANKLKSLFFPNSQLNIHTKLRDKIYQLYSMEQRKVHSRGIKERFVNLSYEYNSLSQYARESGIS